MISDAHVTVDCDGVKRPKGQQRCLYRATEQAPLTALATEGAYDMRGVNAHMEGLGWKITPGGDPEAVCPDCLEDHRQEELAREDAAARRKGV